MAHLPRYETAVRPEWVDYNGHMSDFLYGRVFGEAHGQPLYRQVGSTTRSAKGDACITPWKATSNTGRA